MIGYGVIFWKAERKRESKNRKSRKRIKIERKPCGSQQGSDECNLRGEGNNLRVAQPRPLEEEKRKKRLLILQRPLLCHGERSPRCHVELLILILVLYS